MKIVSLFIFLSMITSQACLGREILILKFTNNTNKNVGKLFLKIGDHGDIANLRYLLINAKKGTIAANQKFGRKELVNGTVVKGKPRKYMNIYSRNFALHNGGRIIVSMPKNVFKKSEKFNVVFDLDRLGDQWQVNSVSKDNINHVEFQVNKVWGVPVGVEGMKIIR